MRRAARIDENQPAIVKALRDAGALVYSTAQLGHGFPDAIVGYRKKLTLLEIKDGRKNKSSRKLTDDEERFHKTWEGYVTVVEDENQALRAIGLTPLDDHDPEGINISKSKIVP